MSVSLRSSTPASVSSARSAAALSMIPLWTTATPPDSSVCGWALASVAGPCVAQRVCPMPVRAGEPLGQVLAEVAHPAGLLGHLDPGAAEHRDARRVVAAVLEPGEALEEQGAACWPPM